MIKEKTIINNVKERVKQKQKEMQKTSIGRVYIRDVQKNIEMHTGIKWQNVDQIYKGYSNGSVEVAFKLANYFGCSVEELYQLGKFEESKKVG